MPALLLTSVDCTSHIHLVVGSNPLAAARCTRSLEVGAKPKVIAPADAEVHSGLEKRIEDGEAEWIRRDFRDGDLQELGREEVDGVVDAVFVTVGARNPLSVHISTLCRRLRIPVNVTDAPNLSSFSLLSTHVDGPLQIGVTTSGRGCKLASRIRREIVSSLPTNLGAACERLGTIRRRIWEEDHVSELDPEEEEDMGQKASFNTLITPEDRDAARNRRIRWLSQICEYWPLRRLSSITDADVSTILLSYTTNNSASPPLDAATLDTRITQKPLIYLAGSGPGHPDLLTTATHKAILTADLILADKLIPSPILSLIPRRTPVHIARKFPGNADKAQEELLELGLTALRAGKTVVRLKQGDPYIYGRGGEEVLFFREKGFSAVALPGVTSALCGPLFAGIPTTQRAVADSILICTGTGRRGIAPPPPPHNPTQTVVFLMALHRLASLVSSLTKHDISPWPGNTPCAVVERASCKDQRVVRSSLEFVCAAVEEVGSRPPGLLVVGGACEVLWQRGGLRWVVDEGWKGLEGLEGVGVLGRDKEE
ncbi:MAG: hypothetical protein M1840_004079 [Geoglossum simile]|nr:MAG: hypothetical protein M1840_004079 [Geoglossum simile]